MKRFKLHQGKYPSYEITRKNFEDMTGKDYPYQQTGKDEITRYFGVCPSCDNPIQLIGLYSKEESEIHAKNKISAYGKHYNKDVKDIAYHNEQAYMFCPYASRTYNINRDSRKPNLTEFEKNVFQSTRDDFDLALYIIEQDTGIYITDYLARRMLRNYMGARGYMYYWATLYNIPWMLLYFMDAIPCYGLMVRKNSTLWTYLNKRPDVKLLHCEKLENYEIVDKNTKFLNLKVSVLMHNRTIENDEVKETIELRLFKTRKDAPPQYEAIFPLDINEYRFPNLIAKAQYRDHKWIAMAQEIMKDI